MFCNQCGQKLPDDARFCPDCGAPVEPDPAPKAPEPPEEAAAGPALKEAEAPAAEHPEPGGSADDG